MNPEDSDYYLLFIERISRAKINWSIFKETFLPIIKNIPIDFLHCAYFEDSLFFTGNYMDKISTFTNAISELSIEKLLNNRFYSDYHKLFDDIYNNLVKYKKAEDSKTDDSVLKIYLHEYNTVICRV